MSEIELNDYAQRAFGHISPIYENSVFMKYLFNGVGMKYDPIRQYFKTFREQSFIDTVTWGIAAQELKYSLDIREDLTLEERRARLGLKARTHRPLNPASLEKYIYERFGFQNYLYEKKAGYIVLYLNYLKPDNFWLAIDWLMVEKPAHLVLTTVLQWIEWHGYGTEPDIIVRPGATIPYTHKDAPRIHAGVAQFTNEVKTIGVSAPKSAYGKIHAGVAQFNVGNLTVGQEFPNVKGVVTAACCLRTTGEIWIDSEEFPSVTSPAPKYVLASKSAYLMTTAELLSTGKAATPIKIEVLEYPYPIPLPEPTEPLTGDAYLPWQPEGIEPGAYEPITFAESGFADLAIAGLGIPRGKTFFTPPDFEPTEYDIVKLFFDFPISRHRRYRGIAMPHPRPDLTREEIKATGQYAVDNELIMNARGEIATAITHAAVKTRQVIQTLI